MKKIIVFIIISLSVSQLAKSQNHLKIGGAYFGNTLTYPGLVLELEREQMFSEYASIPVRVDLGFYYHKRYNTGIFTDVNFGFRRYFKSGLFLEESIGLGIISTFVSSDEVYTIDDAGNLTEVSRYATTDIMPSITLGAGFKINEENSIWIRPKIFWQFPHKTTSFYNLALQIGYSHTFKPG